MKDILRTTHPMCPLSHSNNIDIFFELLNMPVHCNLIWSSKTEAQNVPRGNIQLGYCPESGHIFNTAFEVEKIAYNEQYENSLHFSPRFQSYATALANRLVEKYNLRDKRIIEIGCGQGDFLKLICKLGDNAGIGFDPGYRDSFNFSETNLRVRFIRDIYSERYSHYRANLICCRHVLEHIHRPLEFLQSIRNVVGEQYDALVYFEVPNMLFTLRDLGIWDIIYEHYSYFSKESLAYLFRKCGFEILDINETYEGQFLGIEARPAEISFVVNSNDSPEKRTEDIAMFTQRYYRKKASWQAYLEHLANTNAKTVLWGAGSKGVTFLNVFQKNTPIEYVVDINPGKHNMYIPGTAQRIVPPEFLIDYQPDTVILMNPIYQHEIRRMLNELKVSARILVDDTQLNPGGSE